MRTETLSVNGQSLWKTINGIGPFSMGMVSIADRPLAPTFPAGGAIARSIIPNWTTDTARD